MKLIRAIGLLPLAINECVAFQGLPVAGRLKMCIHEGRQHDRVWSKLSTASAIACIAISTSVFSSPACAALNEQQLQAAELWRAVDKVYSDRTFNGVDWFGLRQKTIKALSKKLPEPELNKALGGMLEPLDDKYTRYLAPNKYQTIVQGASGELAGIGVTLSVSDKDRPFLVDVEENSPAYNAGLRGGYTLVQISGEDTLGFTPDDAAALLRGTPGTRVGLVATRGEGDSQEKLDVVMTRQAIKVQGVTRAATNVAGKRVGVVRIKSFSSTTSDDVKAAIADLRKGGGLDAVALDLRGNVGGLLTGGIDTARTFLPAGRDIVFVIGKTGVVLAQSTGDVAGSEANTPLLIVVDKTSASASEVLTGALKDNNRATVVGQRTFGKGVIQTVEPLERSGGGVAVTYAKYETPLHKNINKVGIPVDVEIECPIEKPAGECLTAEILQKLS